MSDEGLFINYETHVCWRCGRRLELVPLYNEWKWVCPFCDMECIIESDRWWATTHTEENNDETID